MELGEERALISNYRTLGLLKNELFTQIDDKKNVKFLNGIIHKKECPH